MLAINRKLLRDLWYARGQALAIAADVRDFASFKKAVDQAARAFGSLTGIVNNAGMLNVVPITRCNFEDIPDSEWDESFRLNTKSAWYGCKAALPYDEKIFDQCIAACIKCERGVTTTCATSCRLKGAK